VELDLDAFILCEHRYEPGDCPVCDRDQADADEPIQRLRDYLAAYPEPDDSDERLQGVRLTD
jgi:hypothetical protein